MHRDPTVLPPPCLAFSDRGAWGGTPQRGPGAEPLAFRRSAHMTSRPLAVGIAGLGTVGGGVLRMLRENASLIAARAGRPITVVAVSARDRGRDRGENLSALRWYDDPVALAADAGLDVVVELMGGSGDPALSLVRSALLAGRPVVTANKALLALHGAELAAASEAGHAVLAFEAAVAGGIPVIKVLRESLAGNRVRRVTGILNGTCNYILTVMRERGREFAEVLADAQKLGYAEADPSFDVDGVDAAHKLAILAALAFGRPISFCRCACGGDQRCFCAGPRLCA